MHICSTIWFYNTTKTKTNFNTLVNVGTSENRSGYICSNVVETYLRPTPLSILITYGQPHYQSLSFTPNPIINPNHLRPTPLSILIIYGQPHYQSLSFTANPFINPYHLRPTPLSIHVKLRWTYIWYLFQMRVF